MKNLLLSLLFTATCFAQEPEFIEHQITVPGNNSLSATILMNLIPDNTQITNPFIIAEGFDTGSITDPETQYGDTDIISFRNSLLPEAGEALNDMISFSNPDQDYDIIYVNWDKGVADMRDKKVRSSQYAKQSNLKYTL